MQGLLAALQGERRHVDLAAARASAGGERGAAVGHLSALVAMAFNCSTSAVVALRVVGVALLEQIVRVFAAAPDPDDEGATLLAQSEAQIMSVLRAALPAAAEAARAAPPPMVTVGACNICWALVAADAPAEPETVARVVQLLVRALVSPAQRRSGAASDMAFATVQATVLATLARLLVSDYRNRPAARDAVLAAADAAGLVPLWVAGVRQHVRVSALSGAGGAGAEGGGGEGLSPREETLSAGVFAAGMQPLLSTCAPLFARAAAHAAAAVLDSDGALGPDLAGAEGAARSAAAAAAARELVPLVVLLAGQQLAPAAGADDAPPPDPAALVALAGALRAALHPQLPRAGGAGAGGWAGWAGDLLAARAVAGALACAGARLSAADAGVDLAVHLALLPPAPPAAGADTSPPPPDAPGGAAWLRAVAASLLAPIAALFAPGPAPGARLLFPRPAPTAREDQAYFMLARAARALAGLARLLRGWGGDGPGSGALLPAAAPLLPALALAAVSALQISRAEVRAAALEVLRELGPALARLEALGPAAGTAAAGLRAAIAEPLVGAAAQVLTDRGAAAADGAEAHALLLALLLSAPEAGPDEGGEEGEMQEWEAPALAALCGVVLGAAVAEEGAAALAALAQALQAELVPAHKELAPQSAAGGPRRRLACRALLALAPCAVQAAAARLAARPPPARPPAPEAKACVAICGGAAPSLRARG